MRCKAARVVQDLPGEEQGVGLAWQAEGAAHEGQEHAAVSSGGEDVSLRSRREGCQGG